MSYEADIRAGFDVLHIDPSLNPHINQDFASLVCRIEYYIEECNKYADANFYPRPMYEIGTDGHGTKPSDLSEMKRLAEHFKGNNQIKFLVANIGTCVKERCNIGKIHVNETLEFVKLCNENGLMLKCHNSDYLFSSDLQHLHKLGVHSANIAPEYGVLESQELMRLLDVHSRWNDKELFIKDCYSSNKWQKWMINNEHPDKEYLASICGHYLFKKPEIQEMTSRYIYLHLPIKRRIEMHLDAFGWFK